MRLTEAGRELGLVDDFRWDAFNRKRDAVAHEIERLKSIWVNPRILSRQAAESLLGKGIEREYSLYNLLCRPGVSYGALMRIAGPDGEALAGPGAAEGEITEQIELQAKSAGSVTRPRAEVEKQEGAEGQP